MKTTPSFVSLPVGLRTADCGLHDLRSRLALALSVLLPACTVLAYPPSPYHLIYGTVRDEYGTPLMNSQAQVLLVTAGGVENRSFIQPGLAIDVNYKLPVPMDTLLKPDLYRSNALAAGAAFNMYVVIGNTTNIPTVSTTTTTDLGQPTEMTRIDLYLGVDSNGDGIPDAWELAYLAALGSNLTLNDLNADLVLASNGRTLMEEYLRGTYAFDLSNLEAFAVRLVNFNSGRPILEFPTAVGRSYSVLGSTDLQEWAVLGFKLVREGPSGETRTNFTASAVETLQVQAFPSDSDPNPAYQFFRIEQQ